MATSMLEPSLQGFTTKGRGSGSPAHSASRVATFPSATGTPAAANRRLATGLSIASAEARTPEWVHGRSSNAHSPCIQPSSPHRPCRALNATSICGRSSASRSAISGPTSSVSASTPRSPSALAIAAPLTSETSRSADRPPMRTATRALIAAPPRGGPGDRGGGSPIRGGRPSSRTPAGARSLPGLRVPPRWPRRY